MVRFIISCMYCRERLLTVAAVGEQEAAILIAHLAAQHPSAVRASKSFGDLLQYHRQVITPYRRLETRIRRLGVRIAPDLTLARFSSLFEDPLTHAVALVSHWGGDFVELCAKQLGNQKLIIYILVYFVYLTSLMFSSLGLCPNVNSFLQCFAFKSVPLFLRPIIALVILFYLLSIPGRPNTDCHS